jgi:peptidoglycan-associated lipoprotein
MFRRREPPDLSVSDAPTAAPSAAAPNSRTQGSDMNIKTMGALAGLALLAACAEQAPITTGTQGGGGGSTMAAAPAAGPGSEEDLKQNVGDRVFFDYDKSGLRADGQATLGRQSAWLAQYPQVSVQIAGNCDDRGTEEYNIALGQRRANAARDYLVAKGVAAARITTISYGKDRPTALGDNEEAWKQNRNAITAVQ